MRKIGDFWTNGPDVGVVYATSKKGLFLTGIRDPKYMTVGAAQELRERGAFVELGPDGFVRVYEPRKKEEVIQ